MSDGASSAAAGARDFVDGFAYPIAGSAGIGSYPTPPREVKVPQTLLGIEMNTTKWLIVAAVVFWLASK